MKKSIVPLWSPFEVEQFYNNLADRADKIIFNMLRGTGEEFVKIARKKKTYQEHSGNLKSSIGYAVIKNGKIINENYEMSDKGFDKKTGISEAKKLVAKLAIENNKGWLLIGMAAMKYAFIVESLHHLDVISSAAEQAEEYIKITSRRIFERIENKEI